VERRLHLLKDHEPPLKSHNTALVAAATTSGIQLSEERPFVQTLEEDPVTGAAKRQSVWCLKDMEVAFLPEFEAETITTAEFVRRFRDTEWRKKNPHHPIAYMAWFYETYRDLLQQLRENKPLLTVRRGNRVALVPQGCDASVRDRILSLL
jgi:hypothetical protein